MGSRSGCCGPWPNTGSRTARRFDDLRLPLHAIATEWLTGHLRVLDQGDLGQALLASTAIPGLFPAVEIDGVAYHDGGVVADVPLGPALVAGAASLVVLDAGDVCHLDTVPRPIPDGMLLATHTALRQRVLIEAPLLATRVPILYLPRPCARNRSPLDVDTSDELIDPAHTCASRFLSETDLPQIGRMAGAPHRHEDGAGWAGTSRSLVGRFALAAAFVFAAVGIATHVLLGRIVTQQYRDFADFHAEFVVRTVIEDHLRGDDVQEPVRGERFDELARPVVAEVPDVEVRVDPAQVERIVENLLVNAMRHTPPGGAVEVHADVHDDHVLLRVDDEGPGVPDDVKRSIFDPFHQGPSLHPESPGTGVGLSLVERFAQLHGGRAWVQDRPGGGASFRVRLPYAPTRGTASVAEPVARL